MLFGGVLESEIFGTQSGVLCQAGEHTRTDLDRVVKRENHIRPVGSRQYTM